MPMLRPCMDPAFQTVGEAVKFFRQAFEVPIFIYFEVNVCSCCFSSRASASCTITTFLMGWYYYTASISDYDLRVSHLCRDAMIYNIMMYLRRMFPSSYHLAARRYNHDDSAPAKHYTRTEQPPKYFWTDFGLSHKFDPKAGPRWELFILGGEKSAPEHQRERYNVPCNPIATDVYYVGNLVKEDFLMVRATYFPLH